MKIAPEAFVNQTPYSSEDLLEQIGKVFELMGTWAVEAGLDLKSVTVDRVEVLPLTMEFLKSLPPGSKINLFSKNYYFVRYSATRKPAAKVLSIYLVSPEEQFDSTLEQMLGLVDGQLPATRQQAMLLDVIINARNFPVRLERALLARQSDEWATRLGLPEDWRGPSRVRPEVFRPLVQDALAELKLGPIRFFSPPPD